jgi:hypothetical protein
MTGLDYRRSDLSVREKFAVTKALAVKILAGVKVGGAAGAGRRGWQSGWDDLRGRQLAAHQARITKNCGF